MLLVVDAFTAKKLVVEEFIKSESVPVRVPMNAELIVAPTAERLVVEAFVIHEFTE